MAEWLVNGELVYTLQPCGYRRGKEQFENRISFYVEGKASKEERHALAERLAALLNAVEVEK